MSALLQVGWEWNPSVILGFSLWTLLYIWVIRNRQTSLIQKVSFHLGTSIGLIALISPLDQLGDQYLFSAHMVQHLLLIFLTTPLWLIGTPGWLVDQIIPERSKAFVNRLESPVSAFLVFVSVIWFWHIPSIYEFAQESEIVHIIEHLTFIGSSLISWWPVAGPENSLVRKPIPPLRILYLFLLAVPCTALAAVLTFSSTPLYSFYATAPHIFGLNALQDQHLGGLLMWLPTHMFLLLAIGITFFKWFLDTDQKTGLGQDYSRVDVDPSPLAVIHNEIQN